MDVITDNDWELRLSTTSFQNPHLVDVNVYIYIKKAYLASLELTDFSVESCIIVMCITTGTRH